MPKWSVTGEPAEPENCPSLISLCLQTWGICLEMKVCRICWTKLEETPSHCCTSADPCSTVQRACSAEISFASFRGALNLGFSPPKTEMATISACVVSELDYIAIMTPASTRLFCTWYRFMMTLNAAHTIQHYSMIHMHSSPPHLCQ